MIDPITLVDFKKTPDSPDLRPDFRGIALRAGPARGEGRRLRVAVHGAYQVTAEQAAAIGAAPLHRAVVLTATSGFVHKSLSMVGDLFTFEDDEWASAGLVQGYFSAALLLGDERRTVDHCYLVASVGTFLSNVVTVGASSRNGEPPL